MHIYIYSVINISLGSNVHFEYRLAYYHICMVFYARVTVTKSNCTRASRLCNYFRTVTCAKNKPCKYCKYVCIVGLLYILCPRARLLNWL